MWTANNECGFFLCETGQEIHYLCQADCWRHLQGVKSELCEVNKQGCAAGAVAVFAKLVQGVQVVQYQQIF